MSISYDDVCRKILEAPSSLIYLDTCVLLDIIRSPIRLSIGSDSAKSAQLLINRLNSSSRSLWLVTSATVEMEWHENIADVLKEVEDEIIKIELTRKHFLSAAQAATNVHYQHGQVESELGLAKKLRLVAESLLHACLIVTPEDAHILKAMGRVKKYLPPAKRGKAEPKDCEIYELFLGLCLYLRSHGVSDNFIFLSSNIKDYGSVNSGGVQIELASVGAKYASNLAWAEAILEGRA